MIWPRVALHVSTTTSWRSSCWERSCSAWAPRRQWWLTATIEPKSATTSAPPPPPPQQQSLWRSNLCTSAAATSSSSSSRKTTDTVTNLTSIPSTRDLGALFQWVANDSVVWFCWSDFVLRAVLMSFYRRRFESCEGNVFFNAKTDHVIHVVFEVWWLRFISFTLLYNLPGPAVVWFLQSKTCCKQKPWFLTTAKSCDVSTKFESLEL